MIEHPLSMLTAAEVAAAKAALSAAGELPDGAAVAHIVLDEPAKETLATWQPGDPVERVVRALVVPGPELTMVDVRLRLDGEAAGVTAKVVDRTVIEGMRPALLMGESLMAIFACHSHPDYLAALDRRGITDIDNVQIDPWPAGAFGYAAEEGRRIARCISFV